jgi:hypothetical protein
LRIYGPIMPLLEMDCSNSLVAHSDAYPEFRRTLGEQFNFADFPEIQPRISEVADLHCD